VRIIVGQKQRRTTQRAARAPHEVVLFCELSFCFGQPTERLIEPAKSTALRRPIEQRTGMFIVQTKLGLLLGPHKYLPKQVQTLWI
jgi:hypothetical protein